MSKLWKDSTADEIYRDVMDSVPDPEKPIRIGIVGHCDSGRAEIIKHILEIEMNNTVNVFHVEPEDIIKKEDLLVNPMIEPRPNCPMCNDDPNVTCVCDHHKNVGVISIVNNYSEIMKEVDREIDIEPVKKKKSRQSRMNKQAMYGGKK